MATSSKSTLPDTLLDNSRFYILSGSILLSVMVACLLRTQVVGDRLFYIRAEQIFGLMAIIYWYIALLISPLSKIFTTGWMRRLIFCRRAIGVSAAYFASLHLIVSLWGQLGGPGEIRLLPTFFKLSLGFGLFALLTLLVMAATSFDRVVSFMTYPRWKLLHRVSYIAGVLVILHIWMIGTHVAYTNVQRAAFVALCVLFGLEAYRLTVTFTKRFREFKQRDYFVVLFVFTWLLLILPLILLPNLVKNYHAQHHNLPPGAGGSHH